MNARAKAQTEQWREVLSGHGLSPETIEEILGLSLRARNELAGLFGVDVVGEVSAQAA